LCICYITIIRRYFLVYYVKKVFASYGAVQSHILAHENGHICKICLYEFPDIISCVYHKLEASHYDYLCDSRLITPIQNNDPKPLLTSLHGSPPLEAQPSTCSSSSSASSVLLGSTTWTRTRGIVSPKTIPCSKCKRIFRTQSALSDHFNSKHSESSLVPTLIGPTTLMV